MSEGQNTQVITEKRCTKCGGNGPFFRSRAKKDGLITRCKACESERRKNQRRTPVGMARETWSNIQQRALNKRGTYPTYSKVECRLSKEEFFEWYIPRVTQWFSENPGIRPSIDRIALDGHYELGNIQIISLSDNSRKTSLTKIHSCPDGTSWCCMCQQYIPVESFHKDSHTANGLQQRCKECKKKLAKTFRRDAIAARKRLQQAKTLLRKCIARLGRDEDDMVNEIKDFLRDAK